MSTELTTKLVLNLSATHTEAATLSTPYPKDKPEIDASATLADGTGANQADYIYHGRVALVANASQLHCGDGSLLDKFRNAQTFASVRAVVVKNRSTTAGEYIQVFGGVTDLAEWGEDKCGPGGVLLKTAPVDSIPVTGSTYGITLSAVASGATLNADVMIVGCSLWQPHNE